MPPLARLSPGDEGLQRADRPDAARRVWRVVKEVSQASVNYRGRRRPLLRRYMYPLLGRAIPGLASFHQGVWYFVDTSDDIVGRDIFSYGSYDQEVMTGALELLERLSGRNEPLRGKTFLDVGANIGTSTITAIRTFGASDALSFEPAPANLKLLKCNIIMNDLEATVRIYPLALSNTSGRTDLEISPHNWGDNRVKSNRPEPSVPERVVETVEIQTARLDQLLARDEIDPQSFGLVWMDTQGHEGHVLDGAKLIVNSDVPVILEYWPYALQQSGGMSLLHECIHNSYRRVVDIRASLSSGRVVEYPPDQIGELANMYQRDRFTDLLLLH